MSITIYLGSLCIVSAIGLVYWTTLAGRRTNSVVRSNLGTPSARPTFSPSDAEFVARKVRRLGTLLPTSVSIEQLDRRVSAAGLHPRWTTERIFMIKFVLAIAGAVFGVSKFLATKSPMWALLTVGLAAAGFFIPDVQLGSEAKEKAKKLELQMPDLLDRLTVTVEAGLGFDSALAHIVSNGNGPVYDQFRHLLQDLRLGMPREQALEKLIERTASSDLRQFASAIGQASNYGLPLATVMRAQSADLREKRRYRAEERALKIPVKITFPLVLCILPTIFIVLLAPGLMSISKNL